MARATDNHLHTIGFLLDYSKAFDTINHKILLRKLYHYGIRGVALKWFESYLYNRQQFVCINNSNSSIKTVGCGPVAFRKVPFLAPCYLSFILMTSVIPQSCYPFCSLQMIPTSFIHTVIPSIYFTPLILNYIMLLSGSNVTNSP